MKKTGKKTSSLAGKYLAMDDFQMIKAAGITASVEDPARLAKFFSDFRAVCASATTQAEKK